jgi:hypothetical protein
MQFDRAKLKTVILYTCANCDPLHLGAVKLHKVLYFADMLHYAHVGAPITGATYRKRALGPTCDQLLPTLRDLDNAGDIEVRDVDYFGFRKKEYVPLRAPEIERLSESERSLLDEVIEFVCRNNTAKTISDYSHNRAWEMAQFGDILPYYSAFLLFPTQVSPEAMEWASGEIENLEASAGSHNDPNPLGGSDFRDFRNRVRQARGEW